MGERRAEQRRVRPGHRHLLRRLLDVRDRAQRRLRHDARPHDRGRDARRLRHPGALLRPCRARGQPAERQRSPPRSVRRRDLRARRASRAGTLEACPRACSSSRGPGIPTSSTSRGSSRSRTGTTSGSSRSSAASAATSCGSSSYDGAIYALKELPEPLARREYRLLRQPGGGVDARRRGRRRRLRTAAPTSTPILITRISTSRSPTARCSPAAAIPRPAPDAPRRARRAARPPASRRLLLGRLLALEHALPPRRGRALRLPRRRRDRRAAPRADRRPAHARPDDRRGERGRRAARRRGRGRRLPEDLDPVETAAELREPLRVALDTSSPARRCSPPTSATGSRSGCAG